MTGTATPTTFGAFGFTEALTIDPQGANATANSNLAIYPDNTIVTVKTNGAYVGTLNILQSGTVDISQLYGTGPDGGYDLVVTPEPGSLGLLGVASLGLLRRRRRWTPVSLKAVPADTKLASMNLERTSAPAGVPPVFLL